jgi:hypothetical protein
MTGAGQEETMKARSSVLVLATVVVLGVGAALGCGSRGTADRVRALSQDQVLETSLTDIRLGDGVPVTLHATVRWRTATPERFLKQLEMTAIQQRCQVDVEQAKAEGLKAEAEGQVAIKRADTDAKVAEINAKAEEKRRQSALARAETEAQIAERNARTEAQRVRELAKAEVEKRQALDLAEVAKQREVAKAELEKRTAVDQLDLAKQRELDRLARDKEEAMAQLYAANPTYAAFQVNRELASKVQIAVVPLGSDAGMLGNLVQGAMTTRGR